MQFLCWEEKNLLSGRGGDGRDDLKGGKGDDILIGGSTAYDGTYAALDAIMAEWTSARSYAQRMANLNGTGSGPRLNGSYFLIAGGPDATVFDDADKDSLKGDKGLDWFFAGLDDGDGDKITDGKNDEIVDLIFSLP